MSNFTLHSEFNWSEKNEGSLISVDRSILARAREREKALRIFFRFLYVPTYIHRWSLWLRWFLNIFISLGWTNSEGRCKSKRVGTFDFHWRTRAPWKMSRFSTPDSAHVMKFREISKFAHGAVWRKSCTYGILDFNYILLHSFGPNFDTCILHDCVTFNRAILHTRILHLTFSPNIFAKHLFCYRCVSG